MKFLAQSSGLGQRSVNFCVQLYRPRGKTQDTMKVQFFMNEKCSKNKIIESQVLKPSSSNEKTGVCWGNNISFNWGSKWLSCVLKGNCKCSSVNADLQWILYAAYFLLYILQVFLPNLFLTYIFVVVCCLLFGPTACGIQFPDQGWNLCPCVGRMESQHWSRRAVPVASYLSVFYAERWHLRYPFDWQRAKQQR